MSLLLIHTYLQDSGAGARSRVAHGHWAGVEGMATSLFVTFSIDRPVAQGSLCYLVSSTSFGRDGYMWLITGLHQFVFGLSVWRMYALDARW